MVNLNHLSRGFLNQDYTGGYTINNLSHKINERSPFKSLPPEFRKPLKEFNRQGYITDDFLPEIEKSLLEALNKQDVSSGYSPLDQFRIHPDIKELLVWMGVNFDIYPEVETPESLFGELFSKRIRLISFNEYKRYDLVWEHDINNSIEHHDGKINISIIEDYNKILPLIINFKKEMHQKTGLLPYLGEANDDGDCFLLDKKICRPDYDRIKDDPTISLKNCICILLGIDDFSFISKIDSDLSFITEEQETYSWKDDFVILPETIDNEPFTKIAATMKYREGWQDIISFVKKFISKIFSELEEGNIKCANHNTLKGHNIRLYHIKDDTHKCDFETLPFVKWAQDSKYKIPDELTINENPDGTLEWANPDKTNELSPDEKENSALSGKERQELGRLKLEKITMDLTVKAAIDVGKYITNEKNEGRLIVKPNIIDLINKFYSKIPTTRIDLIWRSISDDYKSGPGRPKKE